jgi:hypothetical protein
VQDVGGGRDRVGAEEQRQPRPPRRGHQAVRQGEVAGDVAVRAGLDAGRLDLVLDRERLGGLAVVPAGLEGRDVRPHDLGLAGELGLQELDRSLQRPVVEPGEQAEGEHVLGPLGLLAADLEVLEGLHGHRGDRHRVDVVGRERAVLQRALVVADPGEVPLAELVGVGDDVSPARQVAEVGLESGRVHRHQDIRRVARGQDVVVGEVELEAGHARQGAGRGADLGGEVRQRGKVIAEGRRLLREPVSRQLHAIAGVARETDNDTVELLDLLGHS